jgi:hypothetical protein
MNDVGDDVQKVIENGYIFAVHCMVFVFFNNRSMALFSGNKLDH